MLEEFAFLSHARPVRMICAYETDALAVLSATLDEAERTGERMQAHMKKPGAEKRLRLVVGGRSCH